MVLPILSNKIQVLMEASDYTIMLKEKTLWDENLQIGRVGNYIVTNIYKDMQKELKAQNI